MYKTNSMPIYNIAANACAILFAFGADIDKIHKLWYVSMAF